MPLQFIINNCVLIDSAGLPQKLFCDIDAMGSIGQIFIWVILALVTFGLAYPFYFYKVWGYAMDNTKVGYSV